jgi:nicotinamide-nucleotide amidase
MSGAEFGALLQSLGVRIVTAESCTGGALAAALTDPPGASAWFERGYVTYANEAKIACLGVSEQALATHGAVSQAVAAEMAIGALARSRAQLALAVTGIAGPTGAVPGKPVGTVWLGWASALPWEPGAARVNTLLLQLAGDRATIRAAAVAAALAWGARQLQGSAAPPPVA